MSTHGTVSNDLSSAHLFADLLDFDLLDQSGVLQTTINGVKVVHPSITARDVCLLAGRVEDARWVPPLVCHRERVGSRGTAEARDFHCAAGGQLRRLCSASDCRCSVIDQACAQFCCTQGFALRVQVTASQTPDSQLRPQEIESLHVFMLCRRKEFSPRHVRPVIIRA